METEPLKHLRTIKLLSKTIGCSEQFIKYLLREGRLTRYKINTITLVSLTEFESIAHAELNAYNRQMIKEIKNGEQAQEKND